MTMSHNQPSFLLNGSYFAQPEFKLPLMLQTLLCSIGWEGFEENNIPNVQPRRLVSIVEIGVK